MTNNILNFKLFKQRHASHLAPPKHETSPISTQNIYENKVNDWNTQYQIPAYQRRTHWSAKQALALRGINFNLPKNTTNAQPKNLDNSFLSVKEMTNNTEFYRAKRLILSGKMSEVCSMLERMEQAGR